MAYRDPTPAIRERIAELELHLKTVQRELRTLRRMLSILDAAHVATRVERTFSRVARAAPILAIVTLGVVGMGAFVCWEVGQSCFYPKEMTAEDTADYIRRNARRRWWQGEGCPTAEDLVASGVLSYDEGYLDPWGREYRIECDGQPVAVRSAGRDGRWATEDDIISVSPTDRDRTLTPPPAMVVPPLMDAEAGPRCFLCGQPYPHSR